jgi:hypothetical protein
LTQEEVVNHKNRDKRDNRRENLEVFANQDEHHAEHEAAGDFDDFNDEKY